MYEQLNIDASVFNPMRDQFNSMLNALIYEANTTGKEGEITVKLKVRTATERNYDKGTFVKEWTEPRFTWKVERKVKESKFDVKSSAGEGFILEFDRDGKPIVREVPNKQTSIFDNEIPSYLSTLSTKSAEDFVEDDGDSLDELDSHSDEIEEAVERLTEEFSHENLDALDRVTQEVDEAASFETEMNYEEMEG